MMIKDKLLKVAVVLLGFVLIFGMAPDSQAKKPNPANENIVDLSSGSGDGYFYIAKITVTIAGQTKTYTCPPQTPSASYTWDLSDLSKYPAGGYSLPESASATISIYGYDEEGNVILIDTVSASAWGNLDFKDNTPGEIQMGGDMGVSGAALETSGQASIFGDARSITKLPFKETWAWKPQDRNYNDLYTASAGGAAKITMTYKEKDYSIGIPVSIKINRRIAHLVLHDYEADPKVFCPGDERITKISSNINYDQVLNWEISIKGTGRKFKGDKLPISCEWKGKNKQGKMVKPGKYEYTISAWIEEDGEKTVSAKTVEGKIIIFKVKSKTVSSEPKDRTRTTIGIGEKVICSTDPSISVTWSVTGGGSVSPSIGTSTIFTASKSPSTATVHAKIGTADYVLKFTGISPTSIRSVKKKDIGLGKKGKNNIGAYTTYTITVNPSTVSFYWVEMRENIPKHSWTWPNGTKNGMSAQTPPWSVGYDNKTVDHILDGPFPIGYIHNGTGYADFNYIVTWQEEYKNKDGIWTQWIAAETTNTEYRGADQKCRETHMGAVGSWQGPWQ